MIPYKFKSSYWLKLQHSDWRANLVKDFFLQMNFPPMGALEFIRDHMTLSSGIIKSSTLMCQINVHARLFLAKFVPLTSIEPKTKLCWKFGTLEYLAPIFLDLSQSKKLFEINPPLKNYIKN